MEKPLENPSKQQIQISENETNDVTVTNNCLCKLIQYRNK